MEYISSRTNPLIAHIRKLIGDKGYRRTTGEMVCEGPKMLEEALRWGVTLTALVQTEDALPTKPLPEGLRRVIVPEDLLTWLSHTQTPQKLLFLCKIPSHVKPETLPHGNYLVLEGMQDPGNVGTIWRTADAFGADGLFLLSHCADPWGPKTLRASMGACFRLPVWEETGESLADLLQRSRIPLYATALREGAEPLGQAKLEGAAVVIGSEGKGISDHLLSLCERAIKIPMRDRCESLNAAVAASVILWEMAKRSNDPQV
jgi:TrmH family RNA methyltransferase